MTRRRRPMTDASRHSPRTRTRRRRAVWVLLLLLDAAAVPSLYWLGRDVRGDVANAAPRVCVGDCNDDGVVNEGELMTGIAIALSDVSVEICGEFDVVADGRVTVDELVRAVADSLGPCRFVGTPTVTPLETPIPANARARRTPPPP